MGCIGGSQYFRCWIYLPIAATRSFGQEKSTRLLYKTNLTFHLQTPASSALSALFIYHLQKLPVCRPNSLTTTVLGERQTSQFRPSMALNGI